MKAIEIIREIMAKHNFTNGSLGHAIHRNADVINKRLIQQELSAGILSEMASAMGYKVIVVPQGTELPPNSYIIDPVPIGNKRS